MGMTGEKTKRSAGVLCSSCGELYDTPERVAEILQNSGFCVNLTCLHDLSALPLGDMVSRKRDTGRRTVDRSA